MFVIILGSVPSEFCNLNSLTTLVLTNNPITCYPQCLTTITGLTYDNSPFYCTDVPTGQPTGQPSSQPSGQPTSRPSVDYHAQDESICGFIAGLGDTPNTIVASIEIRDGPISSDAWRCTNNVLDSDPCDYLGNGVSMWSGITCTNGLVSGIHLEGMTDVHGTISSSIGLLTPLTYFALEKGGGGDGVTGTLPPSFSNLTQLQYFSMQFGGAGNGNKNINICIYFLMYLLIYLF